MIRHNGLYVTVRRVIQPKLSRHEKRLPSDKRKTQNRESGRAQIDKLIQIAARWWSRRQLAHELLCASSNVVNNLGSYPEKRRVVREFVLRRHAKLQNEYQQVALQLGITALEVVESVRDVPDIGIDAKGALFLIEELHEPDKGSSKQSEPKPVR